MTDPSAETAEPEPAGTPPAHVVVVTGRSGAGRTTALNVLEDCGYERIETPALEFVPDMLRQVVAAGAASVAIGVDARAAGEDGAAFAKLLARLRAEPGVRLLTVFLDGSDETLRRRYTETRRRHPLSPGGTLEQGLERDRARATPLRDAADLVVDTTHLRAADLMRTLRSRVAGLGAEALAVSVVSFAYRNGLPEEADLVFDCRFLRNPHYEPALRPRTGRDPDVAAFVAADPLYEPYLEQLAAHARLLLPAFAAEGKSYVTFAFGCTGGKHRSVAVAEAFAAALRTQGWQPRVRHREHPDAAAPTETKRTEP